MNGWKQGLSENKNETKRLKKDMKILTITVVWKYKKVTVGTGRFFYVY